MGSIGVRCSRNRNSLWFHLEVALADDVLHPDFRTDGADKERADLLGLRHPWDGLTHVGSRIVIRVLAIPGVVELGARMDYFDLAVENEEAWRTVLPRVIQIIRHETEDSTAKVVVKLNQYDTMPQWHASLLQELFG